MTYVLERVSVLAYSRAVPTLGENLKRLRLAAGYETQIALARAMGGDSSQLISDWERDRRKGLDMSNLLAFARVCRVTVDDVVSGLDEAYDQMRAQLIAGVDVKESDKSGTFEPYPVRPSDPQSRSHLQPGDANETDAGLLRSHVAELEEENTRLRTDVRAYGKALVIGAITNPP